MTKTTLSVDTLAQEIRRVDGNHSLGAGELAERLMPFVLSSLVAPREGEAVATLSIGKRPDALGSRVTFTRATGVGQALPSGKYYLFISPPDQRATPTEDIVQLIGRFHALRPPTDGVAIDGWIAFATDAHAALEGVLGKPEAEVVRPCEEAARLVIDAFLTKTLGAVPMYRLYECEDPTQGMTCGWAFRLCEDGCEDDTTSYMHADLRIEWFGTAWKAPVCHRVPDDEAVQRAQRIYNEAYAGGESVDEAWRAALEDAQRRSTRRDHAAG